MTPARTALLTIESGVQSMRALLEHYDAWDHAYFLHPIGSECRPAITLCATSHAWAMATFGVQDWDRVTHGSDGWVHLEKLVDGVRVRLSQFEPGAPEPVTTVKSVTAAQPYELHT